MSYWEFRVRRTESNAILQTLPSAEASHPTEVKIANKSRIPKARQRVLINTSRQVCRKEGRQAGILIKAA